MCALLTGVQTVALPILFNDEKLYNIVKGMIADANLGYAREYLVDPATLPPEQETPDPETLTVQANAMLEANKQQLDQKKLQGEQLLEARRIEADAAMTKQRLDYELHAKRAEAARQDQVEQEKTTVEAKTAQ